MKKIELLIKCCLINQEYEYNIKGILKINRIIFFLENNKMILDIENKILERETSDTKMIFDFKNSLCLINDLKTNKILNINIDVIELNNQDGFNVFYKILDNEFKIKIKWRNYD